MGTRNSSGMNMHAVIDTHASAQAEVVNESEYDSLVSLSEDSVADSADEWPFEDEW
jgi:hypothetical protein